MARKTNPTPVPTLPPVIPASEIVAAYRRAKAAQAEADRLAAEARAAALAQHEAHHVTEWLSADGTVSLVQVAGRQTREFDAERARHFMTPEQWESCSSLKVGRPGVRVSYEPSPAVKAEPSLRLVG